MKKIVKYSLILALVFTFLAITSFFINDYSKINLDIDDFNLGFFSDTQNEYKIINDISTSDFSTVNVDFEDMEVVVLPSDTYGFEVYAKKGLNKYKIKDEDINKNEILDISYNKDEKILNLTQKKNTSKKAEYKLIILAQDPANLSVNISGDNGIYTSDIVLKNLNLDIDNCIIDIEGEHSYPMSIDVNNCILNIDFEEYDCVITASYDKVFGSLFDSPILSAGIMNTNFKKTIGSGEHLIDISSDNITLNIE